MSTTDRSRSKPKLVLLDCDCPSPAACLDAMRDHQDRLLSLCDRLEKIADSLPIPVDTRECLDLANSLLPTIRIAHQFEENRFYPAARVITGSSDAIEEVIDRLCEEHHEDECFAEEVTEALGTLVNGSTARDAEAIGYMLRGFFGQLRRHVAFENDYLCTPVAEQLQAASS